MAGVARGGVHIVRRLVAEALSVPDLIAVRRLAAMRGMPLADTGYLHLALGDAVRKIEELAVAVRHAVELSDAENRTLA